MKPYFKQIVVRILTWQAKKVLARYKPRIIAVTGNVGKTSTKDAIYSVLSQKFYVRKSQKSFNSETGVPLTILGLSTGWNNPFKWIINFIKGLWLVYFESTYPEWLVLEVGADRPGDLAWLMSWLTPDISVLTKIAKVPVHVEYFGTREAVVAEKTHVITALKPSGLLVIGGDDEDILKLKEKTSAQTISFGELGGNDVVIRRVATDYNEELLPVGMDISCAYKKENYDIKLKGILGLQHAFPIAAALAIGEYLGIDKESLVRAFDTHELPRGRMRILPGIKNSLIIDDSYNAAPVAVELALKTLKELRAKGRKIVVLGDMLELGKFSADEHARIGILCATFAEKIITVGIRARGIAESAMNQGYDEARVLQFDESLEAGKFLQNMLEPGDIILVKGSQGVRMEKIVEEIMLEPERKDLLLVRQDPEWKIR
jgi:UDP-N-acetylmuramoyl-tripeptide--D-alanyl-D-alanine ligase